jgi:hypothetical protein
MLVSLSIVKIFLNKLQDYFKENPIYGWSAVEKNSKIIIMDKYAITKLQQDKYPQIITSRGSISWGNQVLGQFVGMTPDFKKTYGDLIQGAMTINCLAQVALEAAFLADEIFKYLTVNKSNLVRDGILKISNLTIGDEQILDSDSKITITNVPVTFTFTGVINIQNNASMYSLTAFAGRDHLLYLDDYTVSGYYIQTITGSGINNPWVVYTGASSLNTIREIPVSLGDGLYRLTETPLTLYPTLHTIVASGDAVDPYGITRNVFISETDG